MAKSGQKPAKADVGGQRSKAPPPAPATEEGVAPAGKTLPPSSGKSGAKKG
ncbi:MAG: hypothetical protein ABIO45_15355 [Burkholderiaceae bacterium]